MKARSFLVKTGIVVAVSAIGLICLEVLLQLYVYQVIHQGRLFQSDLAAGWRPLANLTRVRKNANGEFWEIRTNEQGYRGPVSWRSSCERRLLILGDSYAFGDGLNLEDRFDTLMAARRPSWSIVNLGVMGYSTDQELIAGRPYFSRLESNDVIIVLTCANDFFGLLRRAFAGRSKPWFSSEQGILKGHPPEATFLSGIRDRVYLVGRLMKLFRIQQGREISDSDVEAGMNLFRRLVEEELLPLTKRGVGIILAYHDMKGMPDAIQIEPFFDAMRVSNRMVTVNLEPVLAPCDCFLKDNHWNVQGSERVAEALLAQIDRL